MFFLWEINTQMIIMKQRIYVGYQGITKIRQREKKSLQIIDDTDQMINGTNLQLLQTNRKFENLKITSNIDDTLCIYLFLKLSKFAFSLVQYCHAPVAGLGTQRDRTMLSHSFAVLSTYVATERNRNNTKSATKPSNQLFDDAASL